MLHDVKALDFDPQGRYRAVITGLRRFTLPITVRRLELSEEGVANEIGELPV